MQVGPVVPYLFDTGVARRQLCGLGQGLVPPGLDIGPRDDPIQLHEHLLWTTMQDTCRGQPAIEDDLTLDWVMDGKACSKFFKSGGCDLVPELLDVFRSESQVVVMRVLP